MVWFGKLPEHPTFQDIGESGLSSMPVMSGESTILESEDIEQLMERLPSRLENVTWTLAFTTTRLDFFKKTIIINFLSNAIRYNKYFYFCLFIELTFLLLYRINNLSKILFKVKLMQPFMFPSSLNISRLKTTVNMHIFEGDTRNFDIISSECYTKYGILQILE